MEHILRALKCCNSHCRWWLQLEQFGPTSRISVHPSSSEIRSPCATIFSFRSHLNPCVASRAWLSFETWGVEQKQRQVAAAAVAVSAVLGRRQALLVLIRSLLLIQSVRNPQKASAGPLCQESPKQPKEPTPWLCRQGLGSMNMNVRNVCIDMLGVAPAGAKSRSDIILHGIASKYFTHSLVL